MNIIWLGHSCFVVESAGWRVVLDPYYVETYPALHIRRTRRCARTATATTPFWRR